MSDIKEKTKTLNEILAEADISLSTDEESKLILWNDDFNTFEYVIYCLINYLKILPDESKKLAFKVHNKGKAIIKTGSVDNLIPYKKILEERGLSVTIE